MTGIERRLAQLEAALWALQPRQITIQIVDNDWTPPEDFRGLVIDDNGGRWCFE